MFEIAPFSWLLWWSVGITATVAVLLWAGVQRGGVGGAVWGITIAYALGALVIMRMTSALIGFGAAELWRTCGMAFLAALVMLATGYAVGRLQGQPSWLRASVLVLLPVAVYGTALAWLDQSLLRVVAARLRTLRPSGAPP